jgi:hypothetical protein
MFLKRGVKAPTRPNWLWPRFATESVGGGGGVTDRKYLWVVLRPAGGVLAPMSTFFTRGAPRKADRRDILCQTPALKRKTILMVGHFGWNLFPRFSVRSCGERGVDCAQGLQAGGLPIYIIHACSNFAPLSHWWTFWQEVIWVYTVTRSFGP